MKLKNIVNLCKQSKSVIVHTKTSEDDCIRQYLSTGFSLYPVFGLPKLDRDTLLTIFDIPEGKRDEWNVNIQELPVSLDVSDIADNETMVELSGVEFIWSGNVMKSLLTDDGLLLFNSEYLAPLADDCTDRSYYVRYSGRKKPYIVVKMGFIFRAIIVPMPINDDVLFNDLKVFMHQYTQSYMRIKMADRQGEA